MSIASRTPEGFPTRCPVCGAAVNIEFSDPAGDAPCPCCGHLLWRSRDEVDAIRERIAAKLDVPLDSVSAPMLLKELGADSLDEVELVMELEEEFGISIPDEAARDIRTVGDAVAVILKQQLGIRE